ncbi:MAG: hypothetical protein F6K63_33000 [Moorea sp. SIO1G6]|uniref:hypothetical protein n=2 Tax=unclassified Moorena TaxID=2683338 RepID=UPI0013B87948|nr:hypothetical protein [Moorena sp. SIO4E2]NEQ07182.1 hypothetical protein [Moorena sp. SIO4E2]NET68957.1 hypothetical protein [Moorena sp. SIO1G6]
MVIEPVVSKITWLRRALHKCGMILIVLWNSDLAVEWASCPCHWNSDLAVEWASCPCHWNGDLSGMGILVEWASCPCHWNSDLAVEWAS